MQPRKPNIAIPADRRLLGRHRFHCVGEKPTAAVARHGMIEASRVEQAPAVAIALQWHPEWQAMTDPLSRALFAALGGASRERTARQ